MRERPSIAKNVMVALIKGASDLQTKTYLNPEDFAIFEKYTGAKESEIRATTPVTYNPDLPSTRRACRIRKAFTGSPAG